jgi:hypothetical protein
MGFGLVNEFIHYLYTPLGTTSTYSAIADVHNSQITAIYVYGWRKLHNEELHNFSSSPSIIRMMKSRRMRWTTHVARMGAKRNAYRILVGKPEGMRPLGIPRCRWVDNIEMEGSCERGNEPSGSIKCWEVLEWMYNWQLLKKGSIP